MTIEEMPICDENDLIHYAKIGDIKNLTRAVNAGVDINTLSTGTNPLIIAISNGQFEIVRFLLKNKDIDVNLQDSEFNYKPIHMAVRYGYKNNDIRMLEILLDDQRVDVRSHCNAPVTRGFTALHLAAYLDYADGIELLMRYGALPEDITENGLTVWDVAGEGNKNSGNQLVIMRIQAIMEMLKTKVE